MVSELTKRIRSAAKGKAPIVAIPMEGHAPVCLDRKRLSAWVKGVQIVSAEVIVIPGIESMDYRRPRLGAEGPTQEIVTIGPARRRLRIEGRAGAVKTTCTMLPIDRRTASLTLHKWATKERAKVKKIIAQGALSTTEIKAAKLRAIEQEGSGVAELNRAKVVYPIVREAVKVEMNRKTADPAHRKHEWTHTEEGYKARRAIRHTRKAASVILRELNPLRDEWQRLTGKPYTRNGKIQGYRHDRRDRKKKTARQAKRIIALVERIMALVSKLRNMGIARDMERLVTFHVKLTFDRESYYNRERMVGQMKDANATIRRYTPPPDEVIEMPIRDTVHLVAAA